MVSIVLPVYNGEQYLELSIQSVLSQTYSDWELIIVNDCSTDSSLEIAEKYACQDARIKIITNSENKRVARSLNIGFGQARGQYFTWTSDDNLYHKRALEGMADYLDHHPESYVVYADMEFIDEKGNVIANSANSCQNLYLCDCVGACFLYRREVADILGGYNPAVQYVDDYEYWLRVGFQYELHHIPEILYQYRFHNDAMTHTRERAIRKATVDLKMSYLEQIFAKLGEADFKVFCTTCLLYDAGAGERIKQVMCSKGIVYDVDARVVSHKPDEDRQYIIFGAGMIGKDVLEKLGRERVAYFSDNIISGTEVEGIPVISFQELLKVYQDYNVLIAAGYLNSAQIIEQFMNQGITDYMVYQLIKDEWK